MNKAYLGVSGVASKDESRYVLNGIYVSKEEVVATDGKCLVTVKRAKGDGIQGTGIVPLSAVKDMAKAKAQVSETILDPKGKVSLLRQLESTGEDRENILVSPSVVVEVEYQQRTVNSLRNPVIRRVRDDKQVSECVQL